MAPDSGGTSDLNLGGNVALAAVGVLFTVGGIVGVGISSRRLRLAKREQRSEEANQAQSPRVRFDPQTSRFVF